MTVRPLVVLLASAVLLPGCAEPTAPLAAAPERAAAVFPSTASAVTRTTLAVAHTVRRPCTGELVDLTGDLGIQVLSRASGGDAHVLRYVVQASGVTGTGRPGDGSYRVAGAVTGEITASHRARAVTVADFKLLLTSSPGVRVGRTRVSPRLEVAVAFPVSADGALQDPVIDGVALEKGCAAP